MHISARRAFLFCISICVAYFALQSIAYAQVGNTDEHRDASMQREEDTYKSFHLQESYGLYVDEYAPVCGSAGEREVQCAARVVTNASGTPMAWSIFVPEGYYPHHLLKAYGLTGRSTANEPPVIAVVVAYGAPYIMRDLSMYSRAMGIPGLATCYGPIDTSRVPCFQRVNLGGAPYAYPSLQIDEAWALEASMDVEIAHAICQNCSILLVEAASPIVEDMMAAVDRAVELGADVVSNSYGTPEFSSATDLDKHFMKSGMAFTASSGDAGYRVEFPASSRYVTAVGGTTLILEQDGTYINEIAWSGSGSGCSAYSPRNEWQIVDGCSNRSVADVSAVADPNTGAAIFSSYGFVGKRGWFKLGGTSLAAPIIAGVYALSGRSAATTEPASSIPYLYGNSTNLRDVTAGSNGECGGSLLCTAAVGYDGPTGLGSPVGTGAF